MRQRLDDTSAKTGLSLSEAADRLANPIVRDRKFPIRSNHFIADDDLAFGLVVGEGMLERVHDEFSLHQAKTLSLTGRSVAALTDHFQRDRAGVAYHRVGKALAQLGQIRRNF